VAIVERVDVAGHSGDAVVGPPLGVSVDECQRTAMHKLVGRRFERRRDGEAARFVDEADAVVPARDVDRAQYIEQSIEHVIPPCVVRTVKVDRMNRIPQDS